MSHLLPCPFCGENEPEIEHMEGTILHPAYIVKCGHCGAQAPWCDKGNHEAKWNQRAKLRAPVADERALDLLDTLFTAYENGTPCYEEPDSQGGYLGVAFRIDDGTFRACADLLNKQRPRTAGDLASAPVAVPNGWACAHKNKVANAAAYVWYCRDCNKFVQRHPGDDGPAGSAPVAGEAQLPWHLPVQHWTDEEKAKLLAAPLASEAVRYVAEPNRCRCHPETCCCKDYQVRDTHGEEPKITVFDLDEAQQLAKSLNRAALSAQPKENDS